MYPKLREALKDAEGQSESVIAVIADIRGFSKFSINQESPNTAMYIKRVYMRFIDDYFQLASFYKPTGDGLLIIIPYKEKTVQEKSKAIIQSCLRCHQEFADICKGDSMINFDVPKSVGIGIARGPVCCLRSGQTIIDYSGHLLNLTSRLMDLARPSGIVIDGEYKIELLSEDEQRLFVKDKAYLRSIAEDTPREVYILKDVVSIPSIYKQPLAKERWEVIEEECTKRDWPAYAPIYRVELGAPLKGPKKLSIEFLLPKIVEGKISSKVVEYVSPDFEYVEVMGQPCVHVNLEKLLEYLKSENVPSNTKVKMRIAYVPKPS